MSRSRLRRTALVLLALLVLALPAAAQPSQTNPSPLDRLLATVWSRLSSPLTSLWAEGRAHIDPNGETPPPSEIPSGTPPTTEADGRAEIDPDG